jgi:hypothetical protein
MEGYVMKRAAEHDTIAQDGYSKDLRTKSTTTNTSPNLVMMNAANTKRTK